MKVSDLMVTYGEKTVLSGFNADFPDKEITCVLGPSGCGKTTLLNCIAGILSYSGDVADRPERVGYVFQNPTLFDHLTIQKNVEFVLKADVKDKKERAARVDKILRQVGLHEERDAYPHTLSGGMAQRVSLARAFAYDCGLLLLDEPFKGLDVALKKKIGDVFLSLYATSYPTTVFVTHEIDEATLYANKVIVLAPDGSVRLERDIEIPQEKRDILNTAQIRAEIYDALE